MARAVVVFSPDIQSAVNTAYGPLLKASGLSRRAHVRVARKLRKELRTLLHDAILSAYRDGSMPYRTGRGLRSLLGGIRVYGTHILDLRAFVKGPVYLTAHERGATIRPRRAQALTIPLPAALRPDGTPKLPGPRSWRNVRRTFIYVSKKTGRAYIAYGNGGKLTLLYFLVDEAVLRQHKGFLRDAWNKQSPRFIEALGAAMLFEMRHLDLAKLAGIKYRR